MLYLLQLPEFELPEFDRGGRLCSLLGIVVSGDAVVEGVGSGADAVGRRCQTRVRGIGTCSLSLDVGGVGRGTELPCSREPPNVQLAEPCQVAKSRKT